ncbi:MAG: twin-arginine translocase TatA/TatE family subunit [Alphaproteobacteria bacterium CG11_big_fil_rev_8_21_14_0_20_44_7]|nr:MAG: twin-arginine translocase TatA/TatE family subunit [Alphaproteobacteria bacterium CG11_big_fil_rev_8_21_14_0_20_44_7]
MSIGIWQVVLILLVVLIVFGAGKLPNVMKDMGKGIKGFKEGMDEGQTAASPKKVSKPKKASKTSKKSK